MKRSVFFLLLAAAGVLQYAAPLHAAVVGRVLMVTGEATATREGRQIPLSRGATIENKDVLQTGPKASLQVHFTDETLIALREQSRLAIEDFRYSGTAGGDELAAFRLLKGALRTITGSIGRTDHSKYRLSTSTATMGIRGTMYALGVCDGDCVNADGSRIPDGVFGTVTGPSAGTNKIAVNNQAGETIINQGQHFHVASVASLPVFLLEPPAFLSESMPGKPTIVANQDEEQGQLGAAGFGSDSRASFLPQPIEQIGANTANARVILASQNVGENGLPLGVFTQPITFQGIGGSGIVRGQLVWTTSADLDLRMLTPTNVLVSFSNPMVTFGGATARLDVDNTAGGTPAMPAVENIFVTGSVPAGNYTFSVNNFRGVPTASILRVTGDDGRTGRTYSVPTLLGGKTSGDFVVTRNPNGTATYSP